MNYRLLKLDILTAICTKENIGTILKEFQSYIKHNNVEYVCAVIRALGRVADVDNDVSGKCIEGLLLLMTVNKSTVVIEQIVEVLRQLIQQNSGTTQSQRALSILAKSLISEEKSITEPLARANIVWLVGEYCDVLLGAAPDILRLLAKSYIEESIETKTQIMNFAIKLSLKFPVNENVQNLMTYVLELSRYDLDTDLRDRSRFMTAIMGLAPSNEEQEGGDNISSANAVDEAALELLAEKSHDIILVPKLPPVTLLGSVDVEGLPDFNIGSLSSLVGHNVYGYQSMQTWPEIQPDPTVRDHIRSADNEFGNTAPYTDKTTTKTTKDSLKGFYDHEDVVHKGSGKGRSRKKSGSDSDSDSDSGSGNESSSHEESSDDDSEESGSDNESDNSDSDSENADDTKSQTSSSSENDSENSTESSSASDDDEAIRVPIAQVKTQIRQGIRRVVPGSSSTSVATKKRDYSSSGGLEDLIPGLAISSTNSGSSSSSQQSTRGFSSVSDNSLNIFGSIADFSSSSNSSSGGGILTSSVAPGASFGGAMDDLSDIFTPSMLAASQPTFGIFGELTSLDSPIRHHPSNQSSMSSTAATTGTGTVFQSPSNASMNQLSSSSSTAAAGAGAGPMQSTMQQSSPMQSQFGQGPSMPLTPQQMWQQQQQQQQQLQQQQQQQFMIMQSQQLMQQQSLMGQGQMMGMPGTPTGAMGGVGGGLGLTAPSAFPLMNTSGPGMAPAGGAWMPNMNYGQMQPMSMGMGMNMGGGGGSTQLLPTSPMANSTSISATTSASAQGAAVDVDEVLSEPKLILNPDLASGLLVTLVHRFSTMPVAYFGAHCVYFVMKNTADRNIRY